MDQRFDADRKRSDAVRRAVEEARRQRRQRGGNADDMMDTPSEAVSRAIQQAHEAQGSTSQAVQQAVEQARRRRQRGGNADMSAAVQHAVQQARQAAQRGQTAAERARRQRGGDMEGGWASGALKVGRLEQRLRASGKGKITKAGKLSLNHSRSFRAVVNGAPLKGYGKITKTNKKTGEKTTKEGETNRYFHGDPAAAARKVVASLHKGQAKGLPGSRNVSGIGSAVKIQLIEVTKGVRKSPTAAEKAKHVQGKRFVYNYFGWREALDVPKTIQKHDAKTGATVTVTVANKNVAVPVKKAGSASAALAVSKALGATIKELKDMPAGDRAAIAAGKLQARKSEVAARKAARAAKKASKPSAQYY